MLYKGLSRVRWKSQARFLGELQLVTVVAYPSFAFDTYKSKRQDLTPDPYVGVALLVDKEFLMGDPEVHRPWGNQKIEIMPFLTTEVGNIKLGINAPKGGSVNREEIYKRKQEKLNAHDV